MLVGGLVLLLVMGVVQLTLALHVRNTLIDSASEGARYGALEGRTPADGAARTRDLVRGSLAERYAAAVTASRVEHDGVELVQVQVRAPLPMIGLLGPTGGLTVSGHAIAEESLP